MTEPVETIRRTSQDPPGGFSAQAPELSARIVIPIFHYVEDNHGPEVLRDILRNLNRDPGKAFDQKVWYSADEVEEIFEIVYALAGGDEAFERASVYKIRETLGPFRYLMWAAKPALLYQRMFHSLHSYSTISSVTELDVTQNSVRAVYKSTRQESRLLCASRRASVATLPTLWGLPPARVTQHRCIAAGDDACEYVVEWKSHQARPRILLSAVLGVCLSATALNLGFSSLFALVAGPAAAVFAALFVFQTRMHNERIEDAEELRTALDVGMQESRETRNELLAMHERKREWISQLETELDERSSAWQSMLGEIESTRVQQLGFLRAVSHDLASPAQVLRINTELVMRDLRAGQLPQLDVVEDQLLALERLTGLLDHLSARVWSEKRERKLRNVEITSLGEKLRRRLSALAHGSGLQVVVSSTREAPEKIETDPLVFDRVVDNLLTNAVKYTARGTISIEVGGKPDFLVLKVADTGRGITDEDLLKMFTPEASDPARRAPNSHGIGLSVVAKLLYELGGQLEVMSKVNVGTTFWVHVPIDANKEIARRKSAKEDSDSGVVVVRRSSTEPRGGYSWTA